MRLKKDVAAFVYKALSRRSQPEWAVSIESKRAKTLIVGHDQGPARAVLPDEGRRQVEIPLISAHHATSPTRLQGTTSTPVRFCAASPPYTRRARSLRGAPDEARSPPQLIERCEEVGGDGASGLDLRGQQGHSRLHDDIHFEARAASEEMQVGRERTVDPGLQYLRHDPGLEDRAAERVLAELVGRADAEEPADHAGVEEVQLRSLHEALRDVRVERRQAPRDVPGLEHREPRLRGTCVSPASAPSDERFTSCPPGLRRGGGRSGTPPGRRR